MARALAIPRGCSTRKAGGVYLESGLTPFGCPIEELLFDPAIAEKDGGSPAWFKPHRSPILFEKDGGWHVLIWVGAEFYPNVWDFIEEVRVAGASRRVPENMDFSKLSDRSRMFFVHATAWTRAAAENDKSYCHCPKKTHALFEDERSCIGGSLYTATPTIVENGVKWRGLPCGHRYRVHGPAKDETLQGLLDLVAGMESGPGMFLQMAITGIALIRHKDGSFDAQVRERAQQAKQIEVFEADG